MADPLDRLNAIDRLTVDQSEAARLSGLGAKTLGRFADRGEPVGRFRCGRRVLFHVGTLNLWLLAKATAATSTTTSPTT